MRFRFCGDLDCPDWVLVEIATLSELPHGRIKYLVGQILSYCIEGSFDYDKVSKIVENNADGKSELKGSVAAVHFIITSAAKHDLDESSLVQEIQQLGLPKENADAIGRHYRDSKDTLRTQLAEESYRLPKLVDVEWRVDAVLASSSNSATEGTTETGAGDDSDAVVHLRLCVDNCSQSAGTSESTAVIGGMSANRWQDIAFALSPEKLDVLVHELSQAALLLENLENSS